MGIEPEKAPDNPSSSLHTPSLHQKARIVLRRFTPADLDTVVRFWNSAYAQQRNFTPLTPEDFQRRVLTCDAFQPEGFILAWAEDRTLAGMVHALRPMPAEGLYARWGPQPGIAHLYVAPQARGRGVGTRLLQAAENRLYYCPIYVGASGQACYGAVEGPRSPLFGSTQALTLDAQDVETIRFFARRGYRAHEPGDITLRLSDRPRLRPVPPAEAVLPAHLRLLEVTHENPYAGQEPPGREEYSLWGDNQGDPYAALLIVGDAESGARSTRAGQVKHADNRTGEMRLYGHISWYPMRRAGHAAIAGFWLSPHLRGRKVGSFLLDSALHRIYTAPPPIGGYRAVEVHTHTVRHPVATRLYESRGFELEAAWAALVKM